MRLLKHPTLAMAALALLILAGGSAVWADDSEDAVHVLFTRGGADVGSFETDAALFVNESCTLQDMPSEMSGLMFTRRKFRDSAAATLRVPAGMTVYIAVGAGSPAKAARAWLDSSGWTAVGEVHLHPNDTCGYVLAYKHQFDKDSKVIVPGGGFAGTIVIARNIVVDASSKNPKPAPTSADTPHAAPASKGNAHWGNSDSAPATMIARAQSSIKTLYVIEQEKGIMLGGAADFIATADPGDPKGDILVTFATPVGPQMQMVLDDVIRRLHVVYPRIGGTDKIEFSFEDKYDPHDGGSIGAACGTLLLSLIRGFEIDPDLAMTGDVTADGKVRAIGGVGAKLRGAKASGCKLVAVPTENTEQLLDAMIYSGRSTLLDVQVLGISTLDDATTKARVDRDPKLAQAISLFAEVQKSVQDSPGYLSSTDAQQKLQKVLDLAPDHLSAKLLLGSMSNKQRRRLSATASEYYTFVAVDTMLPTLYAKEGYKPNNVDAVSDVSVDAGLKDLKKLRPMADPSVRPLVDAWMEFATALQAAGGWNGTVESKAQEVRDSMAKLNADQDLAQKMLKEGI